MSELRAGDIVKAMLRGDYVRGVILGEVKGQDGAKLFSIVTTTGTGFHAWQSAPEQVELEERPELRAGMAVRVVNRGTGDVDDGTIEDPEIVQPNNMVAVACGEQRFLESVGMLVARTLL